MNQCKRDVSLIHSGLGLGRHDVLKKKGPSPSLCNRSVIRALKTHKFIIPCKMSAAVPKEPESATAAKSEKDEAKLTKLTKTHEAKLTQLRQHREVFVATAASILESLIANNRSVKNLDQLNSICLHARTEVEKHANDILADRAYEVGLLSPNDPVAEKALAAISFVAMHQSSITAMWLHDAALKDSTPAKTSGLAPLSAPKLVELAAKLLAELSK